MDGAKQLIGFSESTSRRMGDDGLTPRGERTVFVGQQGTVLVGNQEL